MPPDLVSRVTAMRDRMAREMRVTGRASARTRLSDADTFDMGKKSGDQKRDSAAAGRRAKSA